MSADDKPLSQAAGRVAAQIANFLIDYDPGPLAEEIAARLGGGTDPSAPLAILFTDIAGINTWGLRAGDDKVLALLRQHGQVVDPVLSEYGGRLVKRMGSVHMVVFTRVENALTAALEMQARTAAIEVGGFRPRLESGLHIGTPQRVDRDYLGADVNIAARLAEAAAPGELLASGQVLAALGQEQLPGLTVVRRRGFRAKGIPADLQAYAITRH